MVKEKTLILSFVLAIGFSLFIGRASNILWPVKPTEISKMNQVIPEIKLPEVINLGGQEEEEKASLKILNANVIGIYEENDLKGLRILGELINIGKDLIPELKPIIRFYGKDSELLATKVANWNENYQFIPLAPNESGLYDILVSSPPDSETITLEMKLQENEKIKKDPTVNLKVKNTNLEEASLARGDENVAYFKFSGTLMNIGVKAIVSPGIYVWLKDDQGKVIGTAYKTYQSDLLEKGQELEVNLVLIPVSPGSGKTFGFEVKTFGEKL
jgi:hypothetical protein